MPHRSSFYIAAIALLPLVLQLSLGRHPWNRKPEEWKRADVERILNDSPWVPADSKFQFFSRRVYTEPPSSVPVEPTAPRAQWTATWEGIEVWRELPERPRVVWRSSKTIRLAEQRLKQWQGRAPRHAPLVAEDLDYHVVAVEGSESLRILRDAAEDLRDTVYLELPSGLALDVAEIRFVEGDRAGEDFVAFYFPRSIHGQPTLEPSLDEVVFHCKASARTELAGRPNAVAIRVVFSPRKMRARGSPDL